MKSLARWRWYSCRTKGSSPRSVARNWIAEYQAGLPNYKKFKQADLEHPVEQVGAKLRARMPWLQANAPKPATEPLKKVG